MTTLAGGQVDLVREARRFHVVPAPPDAPPPPGPAAAAPERWFGPFAGRAGALDLDALALRLGPVRGE